MDLDRRNVLTTIAGATAISGCLGGPNDDGTSSGDAESDDQSDGDPTATAEPTEPSEPMEPPRETANETEASTPTEAEETEAEATTASDADETVLVAADGTFAFAPQELGIESGTTVAFVWKGSGHNVAVTDQPVEASWAGVAEVRDAGYEHRHTFEVAGEYDYVCEPHEFAGMTGRVVVDAGE